MSLQTPYVLALDQGTGSSKALLLDARGQVVAKAQCALSCTSPQAGWMEQDPEQIWHSLIRASADVVAQCPNARGSLAAIGISTQRESCMAWERRTGRPLSLLLSWQDQRTATMLDDFDQDQQQLIRQLTGLPLDPMFSALKMRWILDQIDPNRRRCQRGEICLGTVDSWLLYRFGAGHRIEAGNASRTQLMDIERNEYDTDLLATFDIPLPALPDIVPSSQVFARTRSIAGLPDGVAVAAVLGDSHAALFAHQVFVPDAIKATQGTGSSIMGVYQAHQAAQIHPGLCRTIAWHVGQPQLAFEGNIRAIGSTLNWLTGLLDISPARLFELAQAVPDSDGVAFVPAFGGLGCPWWDPNAQCLIGGMHLGSTRAHLARATLDCIAHQIADVVDCVRQSGITVKRLCVDGGLSAVPLLMQAEADLMAASVVCPEDQELSALGAGYLAGMEVGVWDVSQLRAHPRRQVFYHPAEDIQTHRTLARQQWRQMLIRSRSDKVNTPETTQ